MRKTVVLAVALAVVLGVALAPAHAAVYSTQFSVDGGAYGSTASLSLPGDGGVMTLTFKGVTNASGSPGSSGALGTVTAGGFSWFSYVNGHTVDLRIVDSGGATGSLTGSLSGGISITGSEAFLNFKTGATDVAGTIYTVSSNKILLLPPPGSPADSPPGGVTSVSANLTSNPEPATMLLIGTGVAGLVGLGARRRRRGQE